MKPRQSSGCVGKSRPTTLQESFPKEKSFPHWLQISLMFGQRERSSLPGVNIPRRLCQGSTAGLPRAAGLEGGCGKRRFGHRAGGCQKRPQTSRFPALLPRESKAGDISYPANCLPPPGLPEFLHPYAKQ